MAKRKPTRKRKPTPTEARAAALVEAVLRIRLDGAQLHDLKAFANAPGPDADAARGGPPWGATDDQLRDLIDRADALIVARTERKPERAVALAVARREALYARAVNGGDYGAALACLKDIAQLQGLYPNVAELRQLVKAQDDVIRELETSHSRPALRPVEQGPEAAGEAEGGGAGRDEDGPEEADGGGG